MHFRTFGTKMYALNYNEQKISCGDKFPINVHWLYPINALFNETIELKLVGNHL